MGYKRSIGGRILRLLYPDRCPVCNRVLQGRLICRGCAGKLPYVSQPACLCCGKPIADAREEYCGDCKKQKHAFCQGKAVFVYQGAVKKMMYRYKYGNRRDYTEFFAAEAAKRYGDWARQRAITLVMPIPLSKKKKRRRGYNQAELFARRFARLCSLPCDTKALARVRDTTPQKQLSVRGRKNNLKNAFKIDEDVVKSKRILLIDDIYTTGSTMDAAASVLKRAGAQEVYFLCVSIGQGQ